MDTKRMYTEADMARAWTNGHAAGFTNGWHSHRTGTVQARLPNPYELSEDDGEL